MARKASTTTRTNSKTAAKKSTTKKATTKKTATKTAPKKASTAKRTSSRQKTPAQIASELKKLDRDIVKMLNERSKLTTQQIEAEENPHQALYNPQFDRELFEGLQKLNNGPLSDTTVKAIYREVVSAARKEVKTQRVAYLGPEYSFSHIAAIERFGLSAELIQASNIAGVFEKINRGEADYGLVPIENSTDGRVVDTLDMFTRLPLRICGEVQLRIHHHLLAKCPRNEITEIYSKPQALSQCRDWLARNMPQAKQFHVSSTAAAAQLAATKPGAAAVASRQAGVHHDLQTIAQDIEDNTNNVTRFAVIGDEEVARTGNDHTAILLQIKHAPGSLADALVAFKAAKVNLTWIESFPLRGEEIGYVFFLDFEGHTSDAKIKKTLKALEGKAVRLDVLGSYPKSEIV